MRVELRHDALLTARTEVERLAEAVDTGVSRAESASPLILPSLVPLPAKAAWLRDQLPLLDELAALALLLDEDGDGHSAVELPQGSWSTSDLLREAVDRRFGPGFAEATGLSDHDVAVLVATLASVGRDVPKGSVMTPEELRDLIVRHPAVATALQSTRLPTSGPGGEQRRRDARALFEGLSPADAAILAMTYPSVVGSLSGAPFAARGHANTVNVVAALADERGQLADLERQHEQHQHDRDFLGLNNNDLEGPIADLRRRIRLYESIVDDRRTIVSFDPSGDGAIAELHGSIDARTRNVGVLVPGTGSDLANYDRGVALRSRQFLSRNTEGDLAMISWMGGDLPDSVAKDAPFASYSRDLGPRLTDFSRDLQLEGQRAGGPSRPSVTVAGHSYGGAVVGMAEASGLVADRVMHIESAGMGHGIQDAGDLPSSQDRVRRYSMTAPGDFIGYTQGARLGDDIGHGADPDDVEGTTRLHTGNLEDGRLNTGTASHSRVFEKNSDSWNNMYEVFIGGDVETYRSPRYEYHHQPGAPSVGVQVGWNDDGERIDIP